MKGQVNPIPKGFTTVTPYLNVRNASEAIEFYKRAFGAIETGRISMPDGSVGHAELEIGNAKIMIADENESWGNKGPATLGGTPVALCLYVKNVDEVYARAIKEGAKPRGNMEVKDEFYGDRAGSVIDPFGHQWFIMTHIEDLTFEEMQQRSDAMFAEVK